MPSTWPTSGYPFATSRADGTATTTTHAADHNNENQAINDIIAAVGLGLYGDGSDGAVTLDGSTTYGWSGAWGFGVLPVSREVFFTTLVIPNTWTLSAASYVIRATQKIEVQTGGVIQVVPGSAANASGNTGGAGGTGAVTSLLGGSGAGGNGANSTAAGTLGGASNPGIGAAGGAGGAGGSGGAGGGAGVVTAPTAAQGGYRAVGYIGRTTDGTRVLGGAGGGGGGGGNTGGGGGGGAGGGVIVLMAPLIVIDGDVFAKGQVGANGAAANGGGGGGGGGGAVFLIYRAVSGANGRAAATMCPGGAAGSKSGTGTAGSAGATGRVVEIVV